MDQLKHQLKELLIERLKFEDMTPDDIGDEDPLFEGGLGLDSIDALELVVGVEKEFGVPIDDEEVGNQAFSSVNALAAYIQSRQQAG